MSWDDIEVENRKIRFRARLRALGRWSLRGFLVFSIIGLLIIGYYFFVSADYDLEKVASMPARSTLLDRNGTELDTIHGKNRRLLERNNIPEFFEQALYAREDANFRDHGGVHLRGFARAIFRNILDGEFTQGASTLTMQLARNTYELREKSINRKLLEVALTYRIESKYSKDEILTHYLNRIYFGSGAHGLEEAARTYFGIPASQLNKHQSAILAGIIRGPHAFSPFRHLDLAEKQAREVLDRLIATEQITSSEKDEILALPINLLPEKERNQASAHATRACRRHLEVILDDSRIESGGLHITTGIDQSQQAKLEKTIASLPIPPGCQAAAISIHAHSGDILGIVGCREQSPTPFNRILDARRGLGSCLTPFLEASAREARIHPVANAPVVTGRQLGEKKTTELLKRLGFTGPFGTDDDLYRGDLSTTPLELATAAATLINKGQRPHTRFIRSISLDDKNLFIHQSSPYPAFAPYAVVNLPEEVHGYSLGNLDFWHLNFSDKTVTLFWIGFDEPKPLKLTDDLIDLCRQAAP